MGSIHRATGTCDRMNEKNMSAQEASIAVSDARLQRRAQEIAEDYWQRSRLGVDDRAQAIDDSAFRIIRELIAAPILA